MAERRKATAADFQEALAFFERALKSGENAQLVTSSLAVFCTRRTKRDQAEIRRVWLESKRTEKA